MLRPIRITLVVLFVLLLLGAGGLYYYNYTHEDVSRPAFTVDEERLEVSVNDPREALTRGLRAFDNVDGEITDRIMVQSVSQFNEDKTFTVRCIVFDDASNYATCERTAVYSDYTPPHFSLSQPMVFGVGETVTFMDRVSAVDCIDGNITDKMILTESTVNSTAPGTYRVKVSVTNRMGDTAVLPLTVLIRNRTPATPTVTLKENLIYLAVGEKPTLRNYVESIEDPLAEETVPVRRARIDDSELDVNTPGVYEVNYFYLGGSGETATAILTVIVQ